MLSPSGRGKSLIFQTKQPLNIYWRAWTAEYLVQSRAVQFEKATNCQELSFETFRERRKPWKNTSFYSQQGLQCCMLIMPSTTQSTACRRQKIARRSSTVIYIHETRTVALFWAKPIHLNLHSTWMKLSSFKISCQSEPNCVFTKWLRWEGDSRDDIVRPPLKQGQL